MKRLLVLAALCCCLWPQAAQAVPTDVSLITEYNSHDALLSSGAANLPAGHSMPRVPMTVTATIRDENGAPTTMGMVIWEITPAGYLDKSTINRTARGKEGVVLTGNGTWRGTGLKKITVTAILKVMTPPNATLIEMDRESVSIGLTNDPTGTGNTPWITGKLALAGRPNIPYKLETPNSKIGPGINMALMMWAVPNRIAWTVAQGTTTPSAKFKEVWVVSDSRPGWTARSANMSVTSINMWYNDGTYYNDNRDTTFCPVEWRHDLLSTITHEVGHSLGLNENTLTQNSIMFYDNRAYFLRGKSSPVAVTDRQNLLPMYP